MKHTFDSCNQAKQQLCIVSVGLYTHDNNIV